MRVSKLKWIFSIVFLLTVMNVQPQNFSLADFKVALVGQFIKNIDWPDSSSSQTFKIVVPADRGMMNTLSVLDGEVIDDKNIEVSFSPDLISLPAPYQMHTSFIFHRMSLVTSTMQWL